MHAACMSRGVPHHFTGGLNPSVCSETPLGETARNCTLLSTMGERRGWFKIECVLQRVGGWAQRTAFVHLSHESSAWLQQTRLTFCARANENVTSVHGVFSPPSCLDTHVWIHDQILARISKMPIKHCRGVGESLGVFASSRSTIR